MPLASMLRRSLKLHFASLLCLANPLALGQSTTAPSSIDYQSFQDLVAKRHPSLGVLKASVQEAQARAQAAGVLSDPQISLGVKNKTLPTWLNANRSDRGMDISLLPPQMRMLGISQAFPWPGTLKSENALAATDVALKQLDLEQSVQNLRLSAAAFYARIIANSQTQVVEQENLEDAQQIESFTLDRYKHGLASHVDALQAHSETAVLSANIKALGTDIANEKDQALVMLGLKPGTSANFDLRFPPLSRAKAPSFSDYTARAITLQEQEAQQKTVLAQKQSWPQLMTSIDFMQGEGGMRMYDATIGFSLPLWSHIKRNALEQESIALRAQEEASLSWQESQRELAGRENERRMAQIEDNLNVLSVTLIPAAREHLRMALVDYGQGRGSIVSVNDARKSLLAVNLAQVDSQFALLNANIAQERIESGFVNEDPDVEVPRLPLSTMGSEMPAPPSAQSIRGSFMEKKNRPTTKPSQPAIEKAPEEPASSGDMRSMGGM